MLCIKCNSEMISSGEYFFCGKHHPPFFIQKSNEAKPENREIIDFIHNAPSPLSAMLREYSLEYQPFLALHRLCDLCEMITRMMAIVGLSEIFNEKKEFPISIQKTLSNELERPTFGSWKNIADISFKELKNSKTKLFKDFITFWEDTWIPFLGHGNGDYKSKIIPLRNKLAHGGRISEKDATNLHKKFKSIFIEIKMLLL